MSTYWNCPCGHRWHPEPGAAPVCPACHTLLPEANALTLATSAGVVPDHELTTIHTRGPAPSPCQAEVPGYEILAELGRGGMGVVYRARQVRADRLVALKMILSGDHAGPDDLARFANEARAVAALQHPNIVAVHEVGEHQGRSFFSLEFCEGGTLDRKLQGVPLPTDEAARLVQTLARAVHAAHQKGIIHRDLKPANVLFTLDGIPKVADFGLAKLQPGTATCPPARSPNPTRTGAVMGTPSYMAPEQASGKNREVGPAADIYALGAILYECLTGRPPFRAATAFDTLTEVIERHPAPPRLLNPRVDRDLESIALKCLEKDPTLRYASAGALAEDLARYLDGVPIQATSLNVLDRLARTLEQGKHVAEFGDWGTMLLLFAVIVFASHGLTFVLLQMGQPAWQTWLARAAQLALMGLVFWRFREHMVWPRSSAEKQLWSVWIGYFTAYGATWLFCRVLIFRGALGPGPGGPGGWEELIHYPISTLLAGFAFFVMGSSYWGKCYAIGLTFFATTALMAWRLDLAPLLFALLWAVVLTLLGLHLRRLHAERSREGKTL